MSDLATEGAITPSEARTLEDMPAAPAPAEGARVVSEALTYAPGAPRSYFRDLALAHHGNGESAARLRQHAAEMRVELPKREERARRTAQARGFEMRLTPGVTPGQGGNFAPPLWLIDHFAGAPRAGRTLAELIPKFPLPNGVQSVNLPRLTSGTSVAVEGTGQAVVDTDLADALVTSPVVPIAGQGDVALQLLEQSPAGAHLDFAIFKDLRGDYDRQLEQLLLTGTGSNGQFFGLLNLPSPAVTVTYTDGTPTGSKLYTPLGKLMAQVADARQRPPEIWLMRTARYAWLATSEDANGLPLATIGHGPAPQVPYLFDDAKPTPLAPLLALPIYPEDLLPANLGAGGNQDVIVACRPSDMLLLESEPRTLVGLELLSGTLQARLQLRRYAAALVGRYPTGVGVLGGTGLVVQSGY